MKLKYKTIDQKLDTSFLARQVRYPCLDENWHFHNEYELIYFLKSNGIRYIGNEVNSFHEGEIYLIGSNLPHLFKNKIEILDDLTEPSVDMIIVQFRNDFFEEGLLKIPEAGKIFELLERSGRGLRFTEKAAGILHECFIELVREDGFLRVINLLKILDTLSKYENYSVICSSGIVSHYRKNEKERICKVINFLTENYYRNIKLEEVAELANMAPTAFCRFFKKQTQKSFSQYLTEIRVENACKQLIESDVQVSDVSICSGFGTLSNFNRKFKSIMGLTPTAFIKKRSMDV